METKEVITAVRRQKLRDAEDALAEAEAAVEVARSEVRYWHNSLVAR